MHRCRCLRCGAVKRGKKSSYTCKCGFYMVPVTGNLFPVAKLLHEIGFSISYAEDYIATVDVAAIEIMMLNLEFTRIYDKKVFFTPPHALSDDFIYNTYQTADGVPFCRITHRGEHFPALGGDIDAIREMKMTIRSFYMWATELENSGAADIYRIAEWI